MQRPVTLLTNLRWIVLASLFATALPAVPAVADHGADHDDCARGSFAWIGDAALNGVTLQALGNQFSVSRKEVQLAASVDGHFTVDVHYRCVEAYHFVATKQTSSGSTVTVDVWQYPACGSGTDSYNLPVGFDLVQYDLVLDWWGCDGNSGSQSANITVFDPPVTPLLE